jgi:thymidine kinase
MVCGNPANHTQRLVPGGDRVLLGTDGTYEARCRVCFDPNLERVGASGVSPSSADATATVEEVTDLEQPKALGSRIPDPGSRQ